MVRWWLMNAIPVIWVAYVDHYEVGREFADLQLRGVFRYFRHIHTCTPSDTGTRYRDSIEFATALGARMDRAVVLPMLRRTFRHRHRQMARRLQAVP